MSTSPVITATPPTNLPQRLLDTPLVNPKTGIITSLPWKQFLQQLLAPVKVPTVTISTHAKRASVSAASVPDGSLFFETDRQVYYIAQQGQWLYFAGIFQDVQANLPTDLNANDAGFLAEVTDYNHVLQWTGTAFEWGPGEAQSGWIAAFVNAPLDAGWQACDGSVNVAQLLSSGQLNFVTVPNTPGSFFRQ